jgi:hypothetical protein
MCRIYTEERNSELHGGGGKKWVVCVGGGGGRAATPYIGGVCSRFT